MALRHANAVMVGAGAGGGIVAKELASAGLSVVLLERGKWYTAADCRKDDLRNQRTTVLGNAFGPDDERNPRVLVDDRGRERIVAPSDGGYSNNAACVGGGTFSYGAMAWRFMEKDFRMRSTYGAVEGSTLEDWPISYEDLEPYYEKGRVGDRRLRRRLGRTCSKVRAAGRCPCRRLPPNREHQILHPAAQAPRPASVRYPDAAQHRALQRTRRLHALPLVRGLRLRGGRARPARTTPSFPRRSPPGTANCAPGAWRRRS